MCSIILSFNVIAQCILKQLFFTRFSMLFLKDGDFDLSIILLSNNPLIYNSNAESI